MKRQLTPAAVKDYKSSLIPNDPDENGYADPSFSLISSREVVDSNTGGIETSMREQASDKAPIESERHTGWFNWAGRHPGVVLLGALVMAFLALQESPSHEDVERDTSDEEVPLFI
jgi:hypothetical protein